MGTCGATDEAMPIWLGDAGDVAAGEGWNT
jgi:hypothetical protein